MWKYNFLSSLYFETSHYIVNINMEDIRKLTDVSREKIASVLMWNYHSEKYTSEVWVGVNFKPKIYNEHRAWYLRSRK